MKVIIFSSPQRKTMLDSLLNELKVFDIFVIDNDKTFGKHLFWYRWECARLLCLQSKHDDYLIIPDDVTNVNIEEIKYVFSLFKNKPFFCNVINDGRINCWGSVNDNSKDFKTENNTYKCLNYFDCGGLTNRKTLELIKINQPPSNWFNTENKSSSVGFQITSQSKSLNIPMFTPVKSLVYHGNHESIMNPIERKINPLISL